MGVDLFGYYYWIILNKNKRGGYIRFSFLDILVSISDIFETSNKIMVG
jgi:hypothetical protein